MAMLFKVQLVCDGCGLIFGEDTVHGTGPAKDYSMTLAFNARYKKWTTIYRGRGHANTHYCPACGDKPMKPVPRKKRHYPPANT